MTGLDNIFNPIASNNCAKSGLLLSLRIPGGDSSCFKPQIHSNAVRFKVTWMNDKQETFNKQTISPWNVEFLIIGSKKEHPPISLA